jgi:hypothetical protein
VSALENWEKAIRLYKTGAINTNELISAANTARFEAGLSVIPLGELNAFLNRVDRVNNAAAI